MTHFDLPQTIDKESAAAVAAGLLLAGPGVVIGGSAVGRIGQVGLQLLVAAERDLGARLQDASSALAEALHLAGLAHMVEGPAA